MRKKIYTAIFPFVKTEITPCRQFPRSVDPSLPLLCFLTLDARKQIYVLFKRAESFVIWEGGKVRNNFSHYMERGREDTSARKEFL